MPDDPAANGGSGFAPGTLLGGYRLEDRVGVGGMAVVYRARDERLRRTVAMKILLPDVAADAAFRRRFVQESLAAAAVDDPHIIPVYEAGEAGGVPFIAMRFVSGGDLRSVLEREGRLSSEVAAWFASPVAAALDAAHAAGLVHRDVKPANILVDRRTGRPDHVYLSDFGISKGAAATATSQTTRGVFFGTPGYTAPEQIQGLPADGRADQYSLACVTFEMLTGAVPFERGTLYAVLMAHVSEPPPALTSRRPDLPAAADQVMSRALAKRPEERFATCADFTSALREALGVQPYDLERTVPSAGPQPGVPSGGVPASGWPARDLPGPAVPGAAATPPGTPGRGAPGGPGEGRRALDTQTLTRTPSIVTTPEAGRSTVVASTLTPAGQSALSGSPVRPVGDNGPAAGTPAWGAPAPAWDAPAGPPGAPGSLGEAVASPVAGDVAGSGHPARRLLFMAIVIVVASFAIGALVAMLIGAAR